MLALIASSSRAASDCCSRSAVTCRAIFSSVISNIGLSVGRQSEDMPSIQLSFKLFFAWLNNAVFGRKQAPVCAEAAYERFVLIVVENSDASRWYVYVNSLRSA